MRYAFVRDNSKEFHVENACRALQVSVSGYYAWSRRFASQRETDDARLIDKIRTFYEASDGVYGVRRIHRQLVADGERCSRNKVARLMRRCGLVARRRRKYRVTTDSKHSFPVAENPPEGEFFLVSEPGMGIGHYLHLDERGLAVSGGCDRSVFSQGCWMVDEREPEEPDSRRCP